MKPLAFAFMFAGYPTCHSRLEAPEPSDGLSQAIVSACDSRDAGGELSEEEIACARATAASWEARR